MKWIEPARCRPVRGVPLLTTSAIRTTETRPDKWTLVPRRTHGGLRGDDGDGDAACCASDHVCTIEIVRYDTVPVNSQTRPDAHKC